MHQAMKVKIMSSILSSLVREKGKFIQVTVTADVHGFTQWFKKPKTVRCIMMIENGGESS